MNGFVSRTRASRRSFMRRLLEILYDGKPEAAGAIAAAAARGQAEIAKTGGPSLD